MKKFWLLVFAEFILSVISGYLVSQMSLLGRMGISVFYNEYTILKVWWQAAFLFFGIQFFLMILQTLTKSRWISWVLLLLALAGLIFTFNDFNHTFSHRLLKERFHVGFYLFWIAWMAHCIYFLLNRKIKPVDKTL